MVASTVAAVVAVVAEVVVAGVCPEVAVAAALGQPWAGPPPCLALAEEAARQAAGLWREAELDRVAALAPGEEVEVPADREVAAHDPVAAETGPH